MSRRQNELLGKFKMVVGDVISIGLGYKLLVYSNRNSKGVGEIWSGF